KVEVTAHNAGGQATATSAATAVITPLSPADTSPPTISGTTVEGQTLTAGNGTWSHSPASFTYKWLRCDSSGANCTAISGATSEGYALTAADVGDRLEAEVTAHNAGGMSSATSAPSAVVTAAQSGGAETPAGGGDGGSGGGGGTTGGGGGAAGGGGGGGGQVTPTPSPAAGTAVAGSQALVKAGKAAIVLRCTGAGSCAGTLLLQVAAGGKSRGAVTIGRAGFQIRSGAAATVSVHLTGKGQGLVRKAGGKGLEAQLAGTGIAPRKLRLKG
ncbi:MAG TPA: hypothetical protein VHV53_06245, partial [Solirubrobacterales bacterium]|nr:hypothetical protein [Solirubrobacterales bacterium]